MALHTCLQLPVPSPFPTTTTPGLLGSNLMLKTEPVLNCLSQLHRFRAIGTPAVPERQRWQRRRWMLVTNVVEESQESSEPEASSASQTVSESEEQQPQTTPPGTDKNTELSELASELKKAMQERKEKEGENLWSGVAEEIREIEWPAFGKVLGTTGVVLSVILGSSVVLLTVNAIFAELSDRVFAGKGVQDFFS